jgi:adenylate kinase
VSVAFRGAVPPHWRVHSERPAPQIPVSRLVLLGPPASGKGTQGELLARELDVPHVSTGELLRRSIEDGGDPLGVRDTVAAGGLVPEDVIERLTFPELENRFLLDGFPRSVDQAVRLDKFLVERGRPIQVAVELRLDDEILAARMALRAGTEHRTDDRREVFLRRLHDYNGEIRSLRDHYGPLLVPVNASGDEGDVFERIVNGLRALESARGD